MRRKHRFCRKLALIATSIVLGACSVRAPHPTATVEAPLFLGDGGTTPRATSPATLSEAIAILSTPASTYQERLAAIETVIRFRAEALPAVPILIDQLTNEDSYVRERSAWALGELGSIAHDAVPTLALLLSGTGSVHQRRTVAEALAKIGDKRAVPALANALVDNTVAIGAARAIGIIVGEDFSDIHSTGYRIDNGVPLIVRDAQVWWQSEGQYINWNM